LKEGELDSENERKKGKTAPRRKGEKKGSTSQRGVERGGRGAGGVKPYLDEVLEDLAELHLLGNEELDGIVGLADKEPDRDGGNGELASLG